MLYTHHSTGISPGIITEKRSAHATTRSAPPALQPAMPQNSEAYTPVACHLGNLQRLHAHLSQYIRRYRSYYHLDHVLWDRNPGFLKSEVGPFSDFKRKSYLTDLKSAHSQESDFQESREVDRFLKMGAHFQERSGSLENGLCVTWSSFFLAMPRVLVAFDTCCSGANL